jgi:hypothetical protein
MIEQRQNPRELVDWLEESVDKNDDESASVLTLDSLVKSGIFRKEKLSVGTRFYLNNQGKIALNLYNYLSNNSQKLVSYISEKLLQPEKLPKCIFKHFSPKFDFLEISFKPLRNETKFGARSARLVAN